VEKRNLCESSQPSLGSKKTTLPDRMKKNWSNSLWRWQLGWTWGSLHEDIQSQD